TRFTVHTNPKRKRGIRNGRSLAHASGFCESLLPCLNNFRCFAHRLAQELRQRDPVKSHAPPKGIQPRAAAVGAKLLPLALPGGNRLVIGIVFGNDTQTATRQACAVRAIEAERARFEFGEADAAVGTREAVAVDMILPG